MSRTVRVLLADLFALTFGFAVVSLSMTVLTAARSSDPLRTTAPAVSLLSPSQGQIVSGNVVVSATASQDTDALQFQISGANLGPAITSGACSVNWNTAAVTDGTYALAVLAFDANGNMTPSGSVAVTVANDLPQITSVATSNLTSTSVIVTWTTNQVSTSSLDYGVNALTSSLPINWNLVTQHSATLSGLTPGTSYQFRASSSNGVGLSANSAAVHVHDGGGRSIDERSRRAHDATSAFLAADKTQQAQLARAASADATADDARPASDGTTEHARSAADGAAEHARSASTRLATTVGSNNHRRCGGGPGTRRAREHIVIPRTRGDRCRSHNDRLRMASSDSRDLSLDITKRGHGCSGQGFWCSTSRSSDVRFRPDTPEECLKPQPATPARPLLLGGHKC